jgi:hypothetical protein
LATKAQRRQATQARIKAMSHPLRAEAFRLIRDMAPVSPKELAKEMELDVKEITYHISELKKFSCIEEVGTRKVKSVLEHLYSPTELHMIDTDEWGELAAEEPEMAEFLVDEFMQSIADDYTASRLARIVGLDEEFFIVRNSIVLDSTGLREALEASQKYEDEVMAIAARSVARSQDGAEEVPVSFSIVVFKMPKRSRQKLPE